jgi:putative membrane protein
MAALPVPATGAPAGGLEAAHGAVPMRSLVMIRCALSLLFAAGVGMTTLGMVAFAAEPPAGQAPPAAMPSTESFLAAVAAGNQFEIASSKLALERAKSAAIKEFANRLIDEHMSAGARLKEAVSQARLSLPPDTLDARHQAIVDDLKARDAATFDTAYVEAQYESLRELAALFRAYATGGDDGRIRQFAQGLMLTMRSHLDDVRKLR